MALYLQLNDKMYSLTPSGVFSKTHAGNWVPTPPHTARWVSGLLLRDWKPTRDGYKLYGASLYEYLPEVIGYIGQKRIIKRNIAMTPIKIVNASGLPVRVTLIRFGADLRCVIHEWTDSDSQMLTEYQAAPLVHMTPRALKDRIAQGKIRARKVKGHYLINRADLLGVQGRKYRPNEVAHVPNPLGRRWRSRANRRVS